MKKRLLKIIFVATVFIFGLGITYSVFTSNANLEANQGIAKFIFNALNLDQLELPLTDLNPGDNKEYDFSITNNSSGVSSDVTIDYLLTIKTYHLVPLVIELYKMNNEVEQLVLTCDETYSRNEKNELICTTPIQEMVHTSAITDNYKLKVRFADGYNGEEYSGLVDYINVEVKSWQKTE